MKYLLDSNTVSDFYDKFSTGYPKISQQLSALTDAESVYISILTLYELEYGHANAPDEKKSVTIYTDIRAFKSELKLENWLV